MRELETLIGFWVFYLERNEFYDFCVYENSLKSCKASEIEM